MTNPALVQLLAAHREGLLATIKRDGYPQLSNVFFTWDAGRQVVRVASTAERLKVRVLRRDPRAALHVRGPHFWAFAVAEGRAEVSEPVAGAGSPAVDALVEHYAALSGHEDRDTLLGRLAAERRVLIELHVTRLYGMVRDAPRPGFAAS